MTRFTKISLTALFALFLTACDKPMEKTNQADQIYQSEQQGSADFQKLLAWNEIQGQSLLAIQQELETKIAEQNQIEMQESLTKFKNKLDEILINLEQLDIKHFEVISFKNKIKESFILSSELIADYVDSIGKMTERIQNEMAEKAERLVSLGKEVQQKQTELQRKFIKP